MNNIEADIVQASAKIQHSDALISDLINMFDSGDDKERKEAEQLLFKSLEQMCHMSNATKGVALALMSLASRYNLKIQDRKHELVLFSREDLEFELRNLTRSTR